MARAGDLHTADARRVAVVGMSPACFVVVVVVLVVVVVVVVVVIVAVVVVVVVESNLI